MNPQNLLPLLLVLAAGGLIALQAPTNALLSKAGGSPVLAALISFVVGTLALFLAWLASGNRPGGGLRESPMVRLDWRLVRRDVRCRCGLCRAEDRTRLADHHRYRGPDRDG